MHVEPATRRSGDPSAGREATMLPAALRCDGIAAELKRRVERSADCHTVGAWGTRGTSAEAHPRGPISDATTPPLSPRCARNAVADVWPHVNPTNFPMNEPGTAWGPRHAQWSLEHHWWRLCPRVFCLSSGMRNHGDGINPGRIDRLNPSSGWKGVVCGSDPPQARTRHAARLRCRRTAARWRPPDLGFTSDHLCVRVLCMRDGVRRRAASVKLNSIGALGAGNQPQCG